MGDYKRAGYWIYRDAGKMPVPAGRHYLTEAEENLLFEENRRRQDAGVAKNKGTAHASKYRDAA